MPSFLDTLLRRERVEPEVPSCPLHDVEMHLRGKLGRPSRFANMTEESYTLIFYCPVTGCNHSAERHRVRTQVPVPGAVPPRPTYSRRNESKREV